MAKVRKAANPALKQLEMLVGDWDMEISGAAFLPDPQTKAHVSASVRWAENGGFLVMYQGKKGAPQATWLIGRDETTGVFKVLYFDSRMISRIYEMSFMNGELRIWRSAPGFSQRFKGVVSKDHKTITAEWEKSNDGKKWEHDFYLKYTKKK